MHKAGDAAMSKNSCQPEGLLRKSALTLSAGLVLFSIRPAPTFASSPIFAR